ncbi:MAG: AMMECR1 family protein [Chloroflexi bacterium]|nr:AMMECR1 family protein [Chloroflexota bacterium]
MKSPCFPPLTPVTRIEAIELGVHGLVISSGQQRGLLLPQVPETFGWSRDEYLEAICRKAGLPPGAWQSLTIAHVYDAGV